MSQILFAQPWIHPEAPPEVVDIFERRGELRRIPKNAEINRSSPGGEVALLLTGFCLFRFLDVNEKEHVLAVILPNRTMGDIYGMTEAMPNMSVRAEVESTALFLPGALWNEEIHRHAALCEKVARNVVFKQESHIEGLLACFTLPVERRLGVFLQALITAFVPLRPDDWNPVPVPLTARLLGAVISTSRPSVSLVLSAWSREGLLKRSGREVLLHGALFRDLPDWRNSDRTAPLREA